VELAGCLCQHLLDPLVDPAICHHHLGRHLSNHLQTLAPRPDARHCSAKMGLHGPCHQANGRDLGALLDATAAWITRADLSSASFVQADCFSLHSASSAFHWLLNSVCSNSPARMEWLRGGVCAHDPCDRHLGERVPGWSIG
jgi:hypothetical protein